ncbi:MAG TPA: hypothetical protein VNH11_03690 [Pirellulales bacterium]|nr:hypothetical protein [Pirellulales bacterium]
MYHLYFIRSRSAVDDENYYDSKTDVYVFGDKRGFDYFVACITAARGRQNPLPLVDAAPLRNGMRAVVLAPTRRGGTRPRIKFAERVIFRRRKPAMELIIIGNRQGYARLAAVVSSLASKGPPLMEHVHLDDMFDSWVVKRSVSLNIRAPLENWSRRHLAEYDHAIYGMNSYVLPPSEDINYLEPSPYTLPDPSNPYLRV